MSESQVRKNKPVWSVCMLHVIYFSFTVILFMHRRHVIRLLTSDYCGLMNNSSIKSCCRFSSGAQTFADVCLNGQFLHHVAYYLNNFQYLNIIFSHPLERM